MTLSERKVRLCATFSDRLNEILAERGKSKRWLAKEVGVTSGSFSNARKRNSTTYTETVEAVAEVLEVSPSWLLGWSDKKN